MTGSLMKVGVHVQVVPVQRCMWSWRRTSQPGWTPPAAVGITRRQTANNTAQKIRPPLFLPSPPRERPPSFPNQASPLRRIPTRHGPSPRTKAGSSNLLVIAHPRTPTCMQAPARLAIDRPSSSRSRRLGAQSPGTASRMQGWRWGPPTVALASTPILFLQRDSPLTSGHARPASRSTCEGSSGRARAQGARGSQERPALMVPAPIRSCGGRVGAVASSFECHLT